MDRRKNVPASTTAKIEEERAKRFLKRLKSHPFIAVVVDDGHVEVFHRGIGNEHIERIRDALDHIKEKDANS
jgi:hypothetical protein